jgi:hypothetical protein
MSPGRDRRLQPTWTSLLARLINRPDRSTPIRSNHTVPYGTVLFLHGYQAIPRPRDAWLRSFSPSETKTLKSLRNNKPSLSTFPTPNHPKIFEDDDEDENDNKSAHPVQVQNIGNTLGSIHR